MKKNSAQDIGNALVQNEHGGGNNLVFNPQTGSFEVTKKGDRIDPDVTVVTEMAEEGFA